MAKEDNGAKPIVNEEVVNRMQELNGNPVMNVKEFLNEKGELTAKEVEIFPRPSTSVAYCTDSKGQVKPSVKVYHEDPEKAFNVATALMRKALEEFTSD